MAGLKTVLLYLLGLAALVGASILMTGQAEIDIAELPETVREQATAGAVGAAAEIGSPECQLRAGSLNSNNVYLPDAPFTTTLAPADMPGEPLLVSGVVYAPDGTTPRPGALLEVWQADSQGRYSHGNRFTLRARLYTDAGGRYAFTTIKPGHYRVGCQLQPAHIHYRVSYGAVQPVFTTLFFEGDPYLNDERPVDPALLRPLETRRQANGQTVLQTKFDIVFPAPGEN